MKRSRERYEYSSLLSEECVKERILEREKGFKKRTEICCLFSNTSTIATNKTLIKTLLITANEIPSESEKVQTRTHILKWRKEEWWWWLAAGIPRATSYEL